MMAPRTFNTVREKLYWTYSNLAMAHAALVQGSPKYTRVNYMIRAKLNKGLLTGKMKLGSLFDDEREKMTHEKACHHCGAKENLSIDHLFCVKMGGSDCADNLVWSCKSCNSSKGKLDYLEWMQRRGEFPPLLVLRRYLKLVITWLDENGLMDEDLASFSQCHPEAPFKIDYLPGSFPAPGELVLWKEKNHELVPPKSAAK
ncbi:MAG: HNH endonuclease [Deltaproteobacteria bacterium]|nr:HNH endonuclease [Deltaproteobacteria bacterium]